MARRRRCLSSCGWLLTVSRYLTLSLINPFSQHVIHLPHPPDKNPKYEDEWRFYVEKFALSLSSSKDEKDYTVVTIYGDRSDLAFWRPGDLTWTKIGFEFASHVIYAGGVFFFTDILFQVSICGITGMQPAIWDEALGKRSYTTKFRILADMNASLKRCSYKIYVVHSQRNLLVVNRTIDKVHHTTKVTVAHLAIRTKEITLTKDLGNRSLLLGSNESISLEGVKGCMPNCIYFTDDAWDFWPSHDKGGKGGQNMGVYYLTDDKFVPHYRGESSLSRLTPPLWVECRA